jgi:transcriptional regulator with XRE-family HTH domain
MAKSTTTSRKMPDFSLAMPNEICAELGARARARRVLLNVSVDELAERIGVSSRTLGNFERTGKCTLETFVRILETLNATVDLQSVLVTQTQTIDEMRAKAATATRQRAYRKTGASA